MESYPDIAEEVIRMYGYDHVTPTFLETAKVTAGGMNKTQKAELKLKRALCATGASEGVHYSFFSPADLDLLGYAADAKERNVIKILNPINEDLSIMRTTLAPQMIRAMARNQKKGRQDGRIYEIGNRFFPKALPITEYPYEKKTDGGILSYKVKMTKPDPKIYELLLSEYNLKADECIFIEDMITSL